MLFSKHKRQRDKVLKVIDLVAHHLTGGELTEARNLAMSHNKPKDAISLVTNWLHDHQVELSHGVYAEISQTCEMLNMPQSSWEILSAIVRDDAPTRTKEG